MEKKPLHEIILDILYYENTEIPAFISPTEIVWKIRDPEISERQVREVLDWLVYNKKATTRAGKYQIDRYEFIDRANNEREQEQQKKPKQRKKQKITPKEHKTITKRVIVEKAPAVVQKRKFKGIKFIYLMICMLCIAGMFYYWYSHPLMKKTIFTNYLKTEFDLQKNYILGNKKMSLANNNLQIPYASSILYDDIKYSLKNKVGLWSKENIRLKLKLHMMNNKWEQEKEVTDNKVKILLLKLKLNMINKKWEQEKEVTDNKVKMLLFFNLLLLAGIFFIYTKLT